MKTETPNRRIRASKIVPGDLVVVGARFATYTHRPELEGESVPVEAVHVYPEGNVGITLAGCREVCARPDAMIELEEVAR